MLHHWSRCFPFLAALAVVATAMPTLRIDGLPEETVPIAPSSNSAVQATGNKHDNFKLFGCRDTKQFALRLFDGLSPASEDAGSRVVCTDKSPAG